MIKVKGIKRVFQEFKDFAMRGNMIDMAVGIVMGAAFSTMVKSIVENTIIPAITYYIGGASYEDLAYHGIKYGLALTDIINFFILALVVFLVIKAMNAVAGLKQNEQAMEKEEVKDMEMEVELLKEIRDLLKEDRAS